MAQILIPFNSVIDDTGILVAGATVTVASVKNPLTDENIASHGAVVKLSSDGLRLGVLYDPVEKGEAWITLNVSKAGSNFTGVRASPIAYAAVDSQKISNTSLDILSSLGFQVTATTGSTSKVIRVDTLPIVMYPKSLLLSIDGINKGEARPIAIYDIDSLIVSVPFSNVPDTDDKFVILNVR